MQASTSRQVADTPAQIDTDTPCARAGRTHRSRTDTPSADTVTPSALQSSIDEARQMCAPLGRQCYQRAYKLFYGASSTPGPIPSGP